MQPKLSLHPNEELFVLFLDRPIENIHDDNRLFEFAETFQKFFEPPFLQLQLLPQVKKFFLPFVNFT